ncbi:alpha/beta fold hydrolase [Bacillus salitolerans]|uniref:Alpha/beta fold hydrolase n=1 Tax=Bacillus salitolerans TaxID=1437434 RepID=A0ABW4LVY2_9BACI
MVSIRQLIKINQKNLEVLQKGKNGRPIIILTGMGCSFDEWSEIAETLSQSNRVIMFHRPGLGESEIGSEERNTQSVVNELNELLDVLYISSSIVLVGHSYGGLCAQHFVKEYPEKVAGIVLVDSTSVDLKELDELDLPVLDEDETDDSWLDKCHTYSKMNKDELKEIIKPTLTKWQKQLPFDIQQHLINFQIQPDLYKAMHSEISNWKKDAEVIRKLSNTLDIPLIVIGRDKEYNIMLGSKEGLPEWELRLLEEKWEELIKRQASLSVKNEVIFAKEASHSIHLDRPDVVIESIRKLVRHLESRV